MVGGGVASWVMINVALDGKRICHAWVKVTFGVTHINMQNLRQSSMDTKTVIDYTNLSSALNLVYFNIFLNSWWQGHKRKSRHTK